MFITLEGMEGAGKTSLIKELEHFFINRQQTVFTTREPGGSELGKHIRSIILNANQRICPQAELLLFLADRAQHIEEHIRPALAKGSVVLCDRFTDSTIAYQGYGRGMDKELLETQNNIATGGLTPDITLLLDIAPEKGLERAKGRNHKENIATTEGRFEAEELHFHQRIRDGFLERARKFPQRFVVLDAAKPMQAVADDAIAAIEAILAQRGECTSI